MFENEFLITKIDRIILVDDSKHNIIHSNYTGCLTSNELYYVSDGEATTYFNDDVFFSKAGVLNFLPKGKNARYEVFRKQPTVCIDIYFQTDIPISNKPIQFKPVYSAKIQGLFKKAFTIWTSKKDGYKYKCISILYEIISELQNDNYIPEKKYNLIKPAIQFIENNFTDPNISYSDLSEMCGISYSYFKRLFIGKFGFSPQKYITQLRINYAYNLLSSGLYNVTQTAELVGIPDPFYFSKVFKDYTGVSPSKIKTL